MLRSLLIAIGAAVILVAILSWQSILSAGSSQLASGWDRLTDYYNQEPIYHPGVLTDETQIVPLIPKMIEANVGLINAPFAEIQTASSRLTRPDGDCEAPKANLDEVSFFLRTNLNDPLVPVAVHHARYAKLAPELVKLFQDYGHGARRLTTNMAGERLTVPLREGRRKVLVTGDSAAFGTLLDDADTLPSRLQAKDSTRQYVNLGVPDVSPQGILCNLTKAVSRYQGQIDEIVYLYGEDDFAPGQQLGTPEEVIAALRELARSASAAKVTVIYTPSLYNIVPELTRYRGYAGERLPNPQAERERLQKQVAGAGFAWLDMGEIALAHSRTQGNPFAVFESFADPRNPSAQGIATLAERFALPAQPELQALTTASSEVAERAMTADMKSDLANRLQKQSSALEEIRAVTARAAKNNRLKRDIGEILKRLKQELPAEP